MSDKARSKVLSEVYGLIAELWCGPPDTGAKRDGIEKDAVAALGHLDELEPEGATLLRRFLAEDALAEEDYIDLFELEPKCALYLGSHSYDEPKTCAGAAVSERNEYMIELVGIYRHFKRVPNGTELPDYLPLMVDFLALTSESQDDPVRTKFIREYFVPYLSPIRSRLQELKTPYLYLLQALERIVSVDQRNTQCH